MLRRILLAALMLVISMPAASLCEPLPLLDSSAVKDRFAANPRPVKDIGDPHIIRQGDEYFAFATGGPIGFNVWRSSDLSVFTKEKALKKAAWVSGDYWAPEVYQIQDKFVMLFTGRWKKTGTLRIGVAMSDSPQGPYEDAIGAPLFDPGYAVIDGTLVYGPDGTPYMIYSRDCSENVVGSYHESHLYGVELAPDLLSVVGEGVLLTTPDHDWELKSGDYHWNEGPFVLEHHGKYYLYYSANGYAQKEYSVGVAVADHPLGPYTKQENNPILNYIERDGQVLVSGPGHNSFFAVGDELFTSYHTHTYPAAPSGNRQIAIDRAGFHADGTAYINGPTLAPQLRPLADLGLINHMRTALNEDESAQLLTDGDTCQSAASSAYVFAGSETTFTWAAPVTADMLLIYPAQNSSLSGEATINGSLTASFSLEADHAPGEAVCLAFEPASVQSLHIRWEGQTGEIMLLGSAQ